MRFGIRFVPSADEDLAYYQAREQSIILAAIGEFLEADADVESKRRKQLRPNPLTPWELRIGDYRVFYEITPGRLEEYWQSATRCTMACSYGERGSRYEDCRPEQRKAFARRGAQTCEI
jgi:mRNA-degrading endonuclease RelE of RelBE toxin-antitoxin system